MPTVQCPRCGKVVRFEGVAGVCPGCGSVVRTASKPAAAPAPSAPGRPGGSKAAGGRSSRGQTDINELQSLAGGGDEQFDPGVTEYAGPSGPPMDMRLVYGIGGAVGLLVLIGLFVVLYNPKATQTKIAGPPPAPPAPVVQPTQTNQPNAPQPKLDPVSRPAIDPNEKLAQLAWWNLRPVKPLLPTPPLTDQMVRDSLKKGVVYLKSQISGKMLKGGHGAAEPWLPGEDALAIYALLHAGHALDGTEVDSDLSTSNDFMKGLLDKLGTLEIDKSIGTYGHSLRLQAMGLAGRDNDAHARSVDLSYLLKGEINGGFDYSAPANDAEKKSGNFPTDGSNSQYGVLGVWAAADADLDVKPQFWADVESHWLNNQNPDGGWGYKGKNDSTTLTMTAAGVASLCFAAEQQQVMNNKKRSDVHQHQQMSDAIDKAILWIGDGNHLIYLDAQNGYSLYGVERMALATGYRFFGTHDWFRELAVAQIAMQDKEGSWSGQDGLPVETSFRLLFLARGRVPLLLDKLKFDGNWNNRPRDASKLAQFVTKNAERTFAWGVADMARDPAEWLESPLLLITTDTDPEFGDDQIAKLRQYVEDGGMILVNNEGGGGTAKKDLEKQQEIEAIDKSLIAKIFPQYPLKLAAKDDLIFTSNYQIADKAPKMMTVTNGSRVLLVYSPTDIGSGWVKAKTTDKNNIDMQTGLNVFVDAAGKSDFHNRLNSTYIEPSVVKPIGEVPIMRIKYAGNWDPEPGSYTRFERSFLNQTSIAITTKPVDCSELNIRTAPIATLTGNGPVDLSKLDVTKIRNYVKSGGVLLIDSAGGNKDFAAAVHDQLLKAAFPGIVPGLLTGDHPIMNKSLPFTDELPKPRFRNRTHDLVTPDAPTIQYITFGSGIVIISDLDLTTGLLGTNTFGIFGYHPDYCESVFKNVVLWTLLTRCVDEQPTTAKTVGSPT